VIVPFATVVVGIPVWMDQIDKRSAKLSEGRRTKALTDTVIQSGRLALPAVPGRNWHASEGDL
jgi:hypothetical protein